MQVIRARNVNTALASALWALREVGELRSSRNGTVLAFPTAVSTVYDKPTERVLFSPMRNANPCFHLVEALWMLAGRNDVKFPATFVKNMKNFSDGGNTFWGAYGYRWRDFFGWDQIDEVIKELDKNPESRRVVMSMWNAQNLIQGPDNWYRENDFTRGQNNGKDVPCNTHIYFDLRGGKLNMMVCCRSNDILWGCYGANVVHMSILQEYIALSLGVEVGIYTQMSNDLHLYNAKMPEQGLEALAQNCLDFNLYSTGVVQSMPLWFGEEHRDHFDEDLMSFFHTFDTAGITAIAEDQYETNFFNFVVRPMVQAWTYRKTPNAALGAASNILASDWRASMQTWINTNHVSFGGAK